MNNSNWQNNNKHKSGNNYHQNKSHKTEPVVHAPYNFVPLSHKVFFVENEDSISHDMPLEDGYCGAIRYEITAESALCVGGERRKGIKENRAKGIEAREGEVDMFIAPDGGKSYAIPGSSQRGMIRNVLEIATFSKMGFMDDRRFAMRDLFSLEYRNKVTDDKSNGSKVFMSKAESGWLKPARDGSGWEIIPCEFARLSVQDFVSEEHLLYSTDGKLRTVDPKKKLELFNIGGCTTTEKYRWCDDKKISLGQIFDIGPLINHDMYRKGTIIGQGRYKRARLCTLADTHPTDGRLVFTGQPSRAKTKDFVFFNDGYKETINVPDAAMQAFLAVQKAMETSSADNKTTWQIFQQKLAEKAWQSIPVFYLEEGGKITTIGLSMMMPIPTPQTPHSLRDKLENGNHTAPELDWAEAIFGRVSEKHEQSLKGRVSFSLAKLAPSQSVQTTLTKAGILGEPKPSYYPAYLEQNLRPGVEGEIAANQKTRKKKSNTYMNADAKLAGWKRYPVRATQGSVQPFFDKELAEKKQLQTKLETVPAGTRFEGVMRFHNLSKQELGALLWCLTWGGDEALCHALGTGKPWGFGRVKITLDQSRWQADIIPNKIGSETPDMQVFMDSFQEKMDGWHRGLGWDSSKQMKDLKAMADPANAPDGKGLAGRLTYMELGGYTASKNTNDGGPFALKPYRK